MLPTAGPRLTRLVVPPHPQRARSRAAEIACVGHAGRVNELARSVAQAAADALPHEPDAGVNAVAVFAEAAEHRALVWIRRRRLGRPALRARA